MQSLFTSWGTIDRVQTTRPPAALYTGRFAAAGSKSFLHIPLIQLVKTTEIRVCPLSITTVVIVCRCLALPCLHRLL
jgi:hypothetical protein